MKYRKLYGMGISILMIAMAFSAILTTTTAQTGNEAATLRVYGEVGKNAAACYTNPESPFTIKNSNEIPPKDFVVFNPAIIPGCEKIFFRMWYQPAYYGMGYIFTEFTYFMISDYNVSERNYLNKLTLPVKDEVGMTSDISKAGLDTLYVVNLVDVRCNVGGTQPSETTNGAIDIQTQVILSEGESFQFLDHTLTYQEFLDGNTARVSYDGIANPIYLGYTRYYYPNEPWYARFEGYTEDEKAVFTIGRWLNQSDSFEVDGVKYTIPAVDVLDMNGDKYFRYITIRANLSKDIFEAGDVLPLLPPFNKEHYVVYDINSYERWVESRVSDGKMPALQIKWKEESIEDRFTNGLQEIYVPGGWIYENYGTLPDEYTEFIIPQEVLLVSSFTDENDARMVFKFDPNDGTDIYVNEDDGVTLRLYGNDAEDAPHPYTTPEGPLDPLSNEAPPKDFVVFNPAILSHEKYRDITGEGDDANEKVFLRQWYVPELSEPIGNVWSAQVKKIGPHIVNEYAYMFINTLTGDPKNCSLDKTTQFLLPIADNSDQIGLDSFDANGDGSPDYVVLNKFYDSSYPKTLDISTNQIELHVGDTLQFLDYKIKLVEVAQTYIKVNIYFQGNKNDELLKNGENYIIPIPSPPYYTGFCAGRHNAYDLSQLTPIEKPWYLQVLAANPDTTTIVAKAGRLIVEDESFFVDGAEYYVSRIEGSTNHNNVEYITIRNPLPKNDEVFLETLTVLKEPIEMGDAIPLLPPFNMVHDMVNDINGNMEIVENVDALQIIYKDETIEGRFENHLNETYDSMDEDWGSEVFSVVPDEYTELQYSDGNYGNYLLVSAFRTETGDRVIFLHNPSNGNGIYINGGAHPFHITASYSGTEITYNDISFEVTISGGTPPYTYSWDFGDGSTSNNANPTHQYMQPGNYTVTVTVTDSNGNVASDSIEIQIFQHCGDVNNDGKVDSADAQLIMQYVVGLIDLDYYQKEAADVNNNGIIDVADAQLIMQYIVGLIPSLPC